MWTSWRSARYMLVPEIRFCSVLQLQHPQLVSTGTQTGTQTPAEDISLTLIFASRGGKCFHNSEKCAYNGGIQEINSHYDDADSRSLRLE